MITNKSTQKEIIKAIEELDYDLKEVFKTRYFESSDWYILDEILKEISYLGFIFVGDNGDYYTELRCYDTDVFKYTFIVDSNVEQFRNVKELARYLSIKLKEIYDK